METEEWVEYGQAKRREIFHLGKTSTDKGRKGAEAVCLQIF